MGKTIAFQIKVAPIKRPMAKIAIAMRARTTPMNRKKGQASLDVAACKNLII